jgi:hypothetical protein
VNVSEEVGLEPATGTAMARGLLKKEVWTFAHPPVRSPVRGPPVHSHVHGSIHTVHPRFGAATN